VTGLIAFNGRSRWRALHNAYGAALSNFTIGWISRNARRLGTIGSAFSSPHAKPSQKSGAPMSGNSDKAAGVANEAIGKAKQGIGRAVGSDKMKAKGAAQELKGDAQKATGTAKNAAKNAVDKTAAALNRPL
jgi:uncharacterized protein YjbJ (UPF0337 family)